MITRQYLIQKRNSTVCGYPGRDYNWKLFDWDERTNHRFNGVLRRAPKVYVDNGFIEPGCQYLHVPYAWQEHGLIYRVRPNESMQAGKVYQGRLIKKQTAEKINGSWYWVLQFARDRVETAENIK